MVGVEFEAHFTFYRLKLELQSMERQWKGDEIFSLSKKTNGNVIGMMIVMSCRLAEIDIATAKEWAEKAEKGQIPTEDIFKLPPWSLKTVVVRLNSGGLMLFAPVKVQDELAEWLAERGPVQWIVLPSNAHTLSVPNVVKRFPEAKIVGPEYAEAKLQHSKALPRGKFDFLTTDPKDMEVINEIMNKEGVHFHSVAGDAVTEAALVIAHKTILECDLLYGHADREGFTDVKRERFWQMRPEDWFPRLFKFALIDCSPDGGCLPAYRFWLMDPNSLGPMASLKGPAWDGSSCLAMAESLRTALDLDFDSAAGVHFEPMTRLDNTQLDHLTSLYVSLCVVQGRVQRCDQLQLEVA